MINTIDVFWQGRFRSIAIAMVKNERDIIEPFLRHNSMFFDAFIVIDNGSVDGTREILEQCASELKPVIFANRPEFAYHQGSFITKVTRFVQSIYQADFITFLDADEFISSSDRTQFEEDLSLIPSGCVGQMAWKTFVPNPSPPDDHNNDPLASMNMRRKEELPQYHKAIYRADRKTDEIIVSQGAHSIIDPETGQDIAAVDLPNTLLFHLPIRSADQLASKAVVGWIANVARDPAIIHSGEGFQWGELYKRVIEDEEEFQD